MGQALALRQAQRPVMDEILRAIREQRTDSIPPAQAVMPKATAKAAITDKQLRALGRRHLLLMLRDQEAELRQLREERELLLLAYSAGQKS
ncbi:MAG: hypothetical protein FWF10_03540 [Clostridiales bacterium]|nr:hypothetical protein [Clostridiales bacterium]